MGGSSKYRYPVVAFDLDGTLLMGTSVSLLLADWQGKTEAIDELERAFRAGEISNSMVADAQAGWFVDRSVVEVREVLASGPWIAGIRETLHALHQSGVQSLLATITWSFAAEFLAERYGFAAVSGTEMGVSGGVLSGSVSRYFDEYDKLAFVREWCGAHGYSMARWDVRLR
jgi:phosphoserine phosphatase